jgi:acyl carrier protein
MQAVSTPPTREAILADVVGIVGEMMQDWDHRFGGEINEDTLLLAGLGFQSIDVVMLAGELHRLYRRKVPFERLLLANGRPVEDVRVGALVDFLVEQLRA